MPGLADEVRKEQGTVDRLYARLDELRSATRDRLREVRRTGPSGSPQNRSERDAFATLYEDRLAQLEAVEDRLCFGRLDLVDGTVRHVGRLGLTDEEHTSLLTDWRAPAAQPFYRATAARPDGVVRRRHLLTRGREVTSIEDEVLDLGALGSDEAIELGPLSGEGALLAAMASARTGRMGDIVATIQAEQDAIIRSPLEGALVVQGGPGTGKTAVALHRAAYLLYAHRQQLERSGVLLVGPSLSFLRYIDQVLPSLGETGVVSTTIGELLPGVHARAEDSGEVARIKGEAGFGAIIRRAVRARQRVPDEDARFVFDGTELVVSRSDVESAIARARRTHKPHNLARVVFVREMLSRLAAQFSAKQASPIDAEDLGGVVEDLRQMREVRVALNLAWMPLTPQRLVEDLFVKPHRLQEAAPGLSAAQRELLRRERGAAWTVSDIPLLDEAAEELGEDDQASRAQAQAERAQRAAELDYAQQVLETSGAGALVSAELLADRFAARGAHLTTAERAAADRSWTYGHVIVDEAQELSAMAWRMLLRRCPTQSMTIVGDVAQTASPAGARSWRSMLEPLLRPGWRTEELTINYRTPAEIADAATRVAEAQGLPVSHVTSARQVENALVLHRVLPDDVGDAVLARVGAAAGSALAADGTGRIAVIAAPGRTGDLRQRLLADELAHLLRDARGAQGLDAQVVVLSPRESKGLEFDVVVLVEPNELTTPADLYVAMTRPTRQLDVVWSSALPAGLG